MFFFVCDFVVGFVALGFCRKERAFRLFCCPPLPLLHMFLYGRKVIFIITCYPCSAPELIVLSQINEDAYNSILQDNSGKSILEVESSAYSKHTVLLMNTYTVQQVHKPWHFTALQTDMHLDFLMPS